MIKQVYETYGTKRKVAEALGITQSSLIKNICITNDYLANR
ncbi:hypothetical protein [Terrilactibacillus laevilacticus]|uniref:TyrR-like helix-turn-helix domain-containing protein n=1 Tax=Terrilactibacillus laevilacticus TaxID=1380157 RepID=A0ABW5PUB8_9BACI